MPWRCSQGDRCSHPTTLAIFFLARYIPDRGLLMRAVRLHQSGLRLEELAMPEPREGEALVRVHAAAITRDELTWSTDRLPAIPSYELSGTVEPTGEPVFALTPFDRDG